MMIFLKTIFYYPLLNLLVFLYNFTGSFGLAIIMLTIFVRLILFYFAKNSIIAQKRMSELQPELKRVQEKYKDSKDQQAKAMMDFYKINKVNPFSGCFPMLIQAPILISLYYVFFKGVNSIGPNELYSFIVAPGKVDFYFIGFLDLAHSNYVLAFFAGVFQFIQSKYAMNLQKSPVGGEFASVLNYQMVYFFPAMTFLIGLSLPSGLTLYWIISSIFSIIQQKIIEKHYITNTN